MSPMSAEKEAFCLQSSDQDDTVDDHIYCKEGYRQAVSNSFPSEQQITGSSVSNGNRIVASVLDTDSCCGIFSPSIPTPIPTQTKKCSPCVRDSPRSYSYQSPYKNENLTISFNTANITIINKQKNIKMLGRKSTAPSPLFLAINEERWVDASELARCNPRDLKSQTLISMEKKKTRLLPLHRACSKKTSPEIVNTLLQTYPNVTRLTDTEFRCLPIHFACIKAVCRR